MPKFISERLLGAKELLQNFMNVSYNIVPRLNFEDVVMSGVPQFRNDEDIERIFSIARLAFVSILGIELLENSCNIFLKLIDFLLPNGF